MMKSSGLSTDPWWTPTFTSNSSLYPSPTRTRLRAFAYIPCTSCTIHSSTPSFLSANQMTFCGTRSNAFSAGWSGGAKVLCILHHWGVQLILAYSWARPAILVVGKGRGGMFLFLLFLHFHSCSSFFPVPLFHLLYSLFYLFSPFLWETTQNDPQGLTCR